VSSGHAGMVNLRVLGDPDALSVTSADSAIWYLLIIASGYLALTTLLSSVRSC
jgi:hypothetical protein